MDALHQVVARDAEGPKPAFPRRAWEQEKFLLLAQNLSAGNNLIYLNGGLRELEDVWNGFVQMKEGQVGDFRQATVTGGFGS